MSRPPEPRQRGNTFGFSAWRGYSRVMSAPHAHNDIEINYCSGPIVYASAGKESTLPADTPCAFWGAKPHQLVQIDDGAQLAFVTVPLGTFMSWGIPATIKGGLLQGTVLVGPTGWEPGVLAAMFERWSVDLGTGETSASRPVELEVEALLYRMSRGHWAEAASPADRSSRDLDRAGRMATFMAEQADRDIRVDDVASTVHLQPNRAASIFHAVFGVSVKQYLGQLRVAEAQRLLLTTELSSSAVAAKAGFQSLSSYHETFTRTCGMSPMRWRLLHRDQGH